MPDTSVPVIEAAALRKTVSDAGGELTILHEISFTLAKGETAAIVGASGSGKSTLLSLLAGLDVPSAGTVRYGHNSAATDIFKLDEDQRAALRGQMVGFVFQSFQLVGNLTALENVMLPLELQGRVKEAKALASQMLTRVGLAERLNHYPKTLSGGEQQRVALARAFVVQPQILMADEPTGNLDHATGERIVELMFDLNREFGTTLLLVTHDRNLAAKASKRLEIVAGRLQAPPTPG
jgi:putative ABC transport system ATP-binding protein